MKKFISRIEAAWRVIFDKDVLLLTWPNGLKDGEIETVLMTVTNSSAIDNLANRIVELFKEKK